MKPETEQLLHKCRTALLQQSNEQLNTLFVSWFELNWLLRTSVQENGLFCTIERAFLPPLYWLVGTSVGQKADFTSPIAGFPWHRTQWRDKGNLFFSLIDESKTPSGKTNRC
jgi:hypothetical protein